jgi:hypothetical protein
VFFKRMFYLLSVFFFIRASEPVFLPELTKDFFDGYELSLLKKTLKILDLEHGFDSRIAINYITYTSDFTDTNFQIKKAALPSVMKSEDREIAMSLNGKIYRLKIITESEIEQIKKSRPEGAAYMEKSYLEPLKKYMVLLDAYLASADPAYKISYNAKKQAIDKQVKADYDKLSDFGEMFFSESEISILKRTTQILDLDYGFDEDVNLVYIFSFSYSDKNLTQKEKDFAKIIEKLDNVTLEIYYEKIYKILSMSTHKMNFCKSKGKWKYYTYINNHLSPALKQYITLLEKYALPRMASYNSSRSKSNIDKWVDIYYLLEETIPDIFY